jgi:hypothetical protein
MPRFFVDLADQSTYFRDQEGVECPDADAAVEDMMTCIHELIAENGESEAKVIATLRDESGQTLARGVGSVDLQLAPWPGSMWSAETRMKTSDLASVVEESRMLRADLRAQRERAKRLRAEVQNLRDQIKKDQAEVGVQRARLAATS